MRHDQSSRSFFSSRSAERLGPCWARIEWQSLSLPAAGIPIRPRGVGAASNCVAGLQSPGASSSGQTERCGQSICVKVQNGTLMSQLSQEHDRRGFSRPCPHLRSSRRWSFRPAGSRE